MIKRLFNWILDKTTLKAKDEELQRTLDEVWNNPMFSPENLAKQLSETTRMQHETDSLFCKVDYPEKKEEK
jgi:hypothetical protein